MSRNSTNKMIKKLEEKNNKNKEIVVQENFEKSLNEWKMPKYSASIIYKNTGSFNRRTDVIVKTIERAIPLSEEYQSFQLFTNDLIRLHKQNNKFLHIGMVQIALKPATRLGLNTSAIIVVRDQRHLKFHDSLLGIVESTLCDGPIYFSCFPNFTVSLTDPNNLHSLCTTLNPKVLNY